jgi:predicted PurR-regulated permease PerM
VRQLEKQIGVKLHMDHTRIMDALNHWFEQRQLISDAKSLLGLAIDGGVYLMVIVFIGVYSAFSPQLYLNGVAHLIPHEHRPRAIRICHSIGSTLWRWLLGRLVAMMVVWILNSVALWLLGIPLALVLGLLSGLFNFIPNFGPIAATIPAVLIALMQGQAGPTLAVYVIMIHVLVQMIDSNVVTPLVQQRMVSLPPVMIICSQVLFASLVGPLGLILATPIAAAILVVTTSLYIREGLHDPLPLPDEHHR